ncbi:hypothetical protein CH380_12215 [Leptospira adleri]|uniref:Uncharacterized protein n=1 Tax=Leptospira adleri TaxID=2023186 RepID=A0A2M9YMP9_9LEPT|nr:hypothetical protein CH380_12215 [Leptospira adleri]PJZ60734.1 hypothetical protein CH376_16795 [Leptospira adleri]
MILHRRKIQKIKIREKTKKVLKYFFKLMPMRTRPFIHSIVMESSSGELISKVGDFILYIFCIIILEQVIVFTNIFSSFSVYAKILINQSEEVNT